MIISGLALSLSALFSSGMLHSGGGHLTLSRVEGAGNYNRLNSKNPSRKKAPPFHITAKIPGLTPIGQSAIKCPSTCRPIYTQRCSASSDLCSDDWLDQLTGVWPAPLNPELLSLGEEAPQKDAVTKSKGGARADESNLRSQGCFILSD